MLALLCMTCAVSMPGMMDTVLNIGLNDTTVAGLAKATGNERFAWDSYRRLLDMFGEVVLGIPHEDFEAKFDKGTSNYTLLQLLPYAALKEDSLTIVNDSFVL